jgi:hypothetical protein
MQCVDIGWLSDEAFVFVKNWQAVYKNTRMAAWDDAPLNTPLKHAPLHAPLNTPP